jgi:acetoin utilization deacetylase AcuC-like enzyme
MMNLFYSPQYIGSAYSFETTRKAKWVADSLTDSPIAGVESVVPSQLSWDQIVLVHDPAYARAVQTGSPRYLAESQGFVWDPGLWPMVLASNGGAVAAALDALEQGQSGSLSSGLHHARRDGGAGFCTFNGLVIAAREALVAGADTVLILDLDAHCGGGTASLIADDPRIWQTDVAVNSFDYYPRSIEEETDGRIRLRLVNESAQYLPEIGKALNELGECGPRFDLCLYNAGMDPFEGGSTGALPGITREVLAARERMVFVWLGEHVKAAAFVLAGGYLGPGLDAGGLVDLHRLTLSAAADSSLLRKPLSRQLHAQDRPSLACECPRTGIRSGPDEPQSLVRDDGRPVRGEHVKDHGAET